MLQKAIQIQDDAFLEVMLDSTARAGFQYVSLGFGSSKTFHKPYWEETTEHIRELLTRNNLVCVQTHLPYYDMLISCEEIDEDMETAIHRCLIASARLGAKWCVYHPRTAMNWNCNEEKALEINQQVIRKYISWAKEAGTGLALENLPRWKGKPEWKFYCGDYRELETLFLSLKTDNLGICWDFGHANMTEEDHAYSLAALAPYITCTHIHDNYKKDDNHLPPYIGNIKWKSLMQVMKKSGYTGPLTLEIMYGQTPMLESYLNYSFNSVSNLAQMMEDAE